MDSRVFSLLLDSWNRPLVFVDRDHVIRYMNKHARRHYAKWGDAVGRSLLECHSAESGRIIEKALGELLGGAREVLISRGGKARVYMRAVRDEAGEVVGYFERYDAPRKEKGRGEREE